ncbi:MAG: Asp23/Gls24 family envelope stress response protein [Puniceicoccaceae bacterium]|nr:MAG: Asp23/Gls24 family envelope stress response protein [Puniceicoccaceae bacterium]
MSTDHPDSNADSQDESSSLGDIKVHHNVVASIVRLAALKVPGVVSVGGGFVDGLTGFFSSKESERGVRVIEDKEHDSYGFEIRLVMQYGAELAKTAYQVQLEVLKQVPAMTGKNVSRVDVMVEGIKLQEPKKESSATPASSGEDEAESWISHPPPRT